jgi:putative aldouronate transport system substrate-binding protein
MLRVISYLASPFGTEEYEFLTYGLPDRDHTMDGTNPVLTKTGQQEVNPVQLGNIARPTPFNFSSDYPDIVKNSWELQKAVHPVAVFDASVGLFSDTALTKGPQLDKAISSVRDDIVQGRKTVDEWDAAVKTWRSGGGDDIRSELEASYAQAH